MSAVGCHFNLSRTDFMSKTGISWYHRSHLVIRENAFKTNVSRQRCWMNPRRALNAWEGGREGDLAPSPQRDLTDEERDRRGSKRVANSIHFIPLKKKKKEEREATLRPLLGLQHKTPLFRHPGAGSSSQIGPETSLCVRLSLSHLCVCVCVSVCV